MPSLAPLFYDNEKRNQQLFYLLELVYQKSVSLDCGTELLSQPSPEPSISSNE